MASILIDNETPDESCSNMAMGPSRCSGDRIVIGGKSLRAYVIGTERVGVD